MPVEVKGLKELDKALGRADKELRKELRGKLKNVADVVAQEARSIAAQKTKKRTGALVRGIKPFSLSGKAGVRSSAVHGGFPYPKRLEFEGRRGAKFGPRASLNPAVDRNEDRLYKATEQALNEMAQEFSK
jgi:hypothetical protein